MARDKAVESRALKASEYIEKIDKASAIVEEVSINLRELLADMRALTMTKQDAHTTPSICCAVTSVVRWQS